MLLLLKFFLFFAFFSTDLFTDLLSQILLVLLQVPFIPLAAPLIFLQ